MTDNHRVTFWRDQISGRWSEAFSQRDEELFFLFCESCDGQGGGFLSHA